MKPTVKLDETHPAMTLRQVTNLQDLALVIDGIKLSLVEAAETHGMLEELGRTIDLVDLGSTFTSTFPRPTNVKTQAE